MSSPIGAILILFIGLVGVVLVTLQQDLWKLFYLCISPIWVLLIILCMRNPVRCIYILFIFNYLFIPWTRYSLSDGLSVWSDILWWSVFIIVIINTFLKRNIPWKQSLNILTLGGVVWALYAIAEIANPTAVMEAWIYSRGFIYNIFLISLVTVLLLTSYTQLTKLIFLFSILTFIAILKGFYQKIFGFDTIEYNFLMESGTYRTHFLSHITRYFSIFTDAGNYGSNMGFVCIVFAQIAYFTKKRGLKIYYFCISILGMYSMFMTGTRGAIAVPLGGLLLFTLINKNIKLMTASFFFGCFIYIFFAHTYVGENNRMISRMRTAFRPTEDPSYLVRKANKQKLAKYLKYRPFGEGLGLGGVEAQKYGYRLTTLTPHDSTYVKIWMETGIVGLTLYLIIYAGSLIWGCYIIMFKIRNDELRYLLTALACGVFGMMISAYGNGFFNQFPTGIMMIMFLAILLNGAFIDRNLTLEKQQALLTANKKTKTI